MLLIEGLRKSYGEAAVLRGVDLTVESGEVVALLGPNGAGKTTLVSVVAGLRRADGGRVTVAGVDALAQPERARRFLGLAPQTLGIYPTLPVRENLALFGRVAGLRGSELGRRVDEVAEALALTARLGDRAGLLSGGQQRRLHTAMAMIHRPPLLFLDEPTVGADVESRRQLLDVVRGLADDGCAVVYATHYLQEVEDLEATVAVLEHGRILVTAPVGELVEQHGRSGVRLTFRGEAPPLDGFSIDGSEAFQPTAQPGPAAARVLASGAAWVERLEGVELVRSDLESAYLELTGRRVAISNEETADVA